MTVCKFQSMKSLKTYASYSACSRVIHRYRYRNIAHLSFSANNVRFKRQTAQDLVHGHLLNTEKGKHQNYENGSNKIS